MDRVEWKPVEYFLLLYIEYLHLSHNVHNITFVQGSGLTKYTICKTEDYCSWGLAGTVPGNKVKIYPVGKMSDV